MSNPPNNLSDREIESALADLEGWSLRDGKLHKQFEFTDFVQAFGFMSSAALCAERANHHPDWSNVYKTVDVNLMTHETGGITQRDTKLAAEFDKVAERA